MAVLLLQEVQTLLYRMLQAFSFTTSHDTVMANQQESNAQENYQVRFRDTSWFG